MYSKLYEEKTPYITTYHPLFYAKRRTNHKFLKQKAVFSFIFLIGEVHIYLIIITLATLLIQNFLNHE